MYVLRIAYFKLKLVLAELQRNTSVINFNYELLRIAILFQNNSRYCYF